MKQAILSAPSLVIMAIVFRLAAPGLTSATETDKLIEQWRGMVVTGAVNSARSDARAYLVEHGSDSAVLMFLAEIETEPKEHSRLLEEAAVGASPKVRFQIIQIIAETAYLEERFQDAIPWLQELIAADASNRMNVYLLGCCYRRVGDYNQATVNFYQIFTGDSRDEIFAASAFNLAEIYEEQGASEDAVRYYRSIAEEYTTIGDMARKKLEKLEGIKLPPRIDPHPNAPEGSPRSIEDINQAVYSGNRDHTPQYLVQVGAFSQRRNAESMQVELAAMGYPVIVNISQQTKKTVYRVRVGPFESREDAQATVDKLANEKGIFSYVIRVDESN